MDYIMQCILCIWNIMLLFSEALWACLHDARPLDRSFHCALPQRTPNTADNPADPWARAHLPLDSSRCKQEGFVETFSLLPEQSPYRGINVQPSLCPASTPIPNEMPASSLPVTPPT